MDFSDILLKLCQGFGYTVLLFAITLVLAIPLGLLVALASMSKFKPLKYVTKAFIWVIRGTPLILQIVVVSFIPSVLFSIQNKAIATLFGMKIADVNFLFCAVAFVINYAAYFAEIYRGGIESISKGQYEACHVLGMTKSQTFLYVILPQVFKRIVPPMSNEIITLVKDTSLARTLGVLEVILAAEKIVNKYVNILPLFYAGIFYLVFNGLLSALFALLEKKLNYYRS